MSSSFPEQPALGQAEAFERRSKSGACVEEERENGFKKRVFDDDDDDDGDLAPVRALQLLRSAPSNRAFSSA